MEEHIDIDQKSKKSPPRNVTSTGLSFKGGI